MTEKILLACSRTADGRHWMGLHHHQCQTDAREAYRREGKPWQVIPPCNQGYSTTLRPFVGREEGARIALAAGQVQLGQRDPQGRAFNPRKLDSYDIFFEPHEPALA